MTNMALPRLLRQAIIRHRMVVQGDRILAAVSGGADSVALLDLLAAEAPRVGFRLAVAHLDHGLRGGASAGDRRFVEEMAGRLGLSCFSRLEDVASLARRERRSLEEAGRVARGRFLEAVAREWGANRIATAHHRDDQAEGVLMRVLFGSGSSGLAAIRPVTATSPPIVRPLLEATRRQILSYLRCRAIAFRFDETNEDSAFLRNRVRARLLPALAADFNPRIGEALARSAKMLRDEDDLLSSMAIDWFARFVPALSPTRGGAGRVTIPEEPLRALHPALRRRVVREALFRAGASPRRVRFDQIESALDLLERRRTGHRVQLADGFEVRIDYAGLAVGKTAQRSAPYAVPLAAGGEAMFIPVEGGPSFRFQTSIVSREDLREPLSSGATRLAHLDLDRTGTDLIVRSRRRGDRFHPLGAPGGKKLNDFLVDCRLPQEQRDQAPLVARGDSTQSILWVVGARISEQVKITQSTRRILRINVKEDKPASPDASPDDP